MSSSQHSLLALTLLLPFMGAVVLLRVGNEQRKLAAWLAGAVTLASFALLLTFAPMVWNDEVPRFRVEWLPSLGVGFGLRLDGLAFLFGGLILGIGALVVLYGAYYLADNDPPARFFAFLLFFMGAMLGVVLADNLILLVVFWELTSVSSFLLIGFWRHREDARQGARMALAVTGLGGLALLAGVLLIGKVVGSYDLDIVLASKVVLQNSPLFVPILLLVLLGAFTKSAQFPFHFWLPRAMAAPTPVSAYLHSATMVKAGVFLLARMYPALGDNDAWFWIVSSAGMITLLMGAVVAIFQHDLKGLLAYSTISHLGLITLLFGLDTPLAVVAGVFHIINHAVFKASLFMAAGIIDHETGSRDMRQLNGLWKHMPITATLALVASAAMAGVPLANGFLSKEMFFVEATVVDSHQLLQFATPIAATIAGMAGVAYSLRFIHDVFFNGEPVGLTKTPHEPPRFMRVPVEILVVLCLVVGVFPAYTVGPLLSVAAQATLNLPLAAQMPQYTLSIWHGFNLPLLMSAIAMAGGVTVYVLLQRKINLHTVGKLPGDAKVLFDVFIENITVIAGALTRLTQNGSLQRYLLLIVVTAIAVAVAAVWLYPAVGVVSNLPMESANVVVMGVALIGVVAVIGTVVVHRARLTALIYMGVAGLVVALTFVYFSAPDLALTQLLVEVVTIILMMLALNFLPKQSKPELAGRRQVNWRDAIVASAAGIGVGWIVYQVLTRPFASISPYFLQTSVPQGGGANSVNVIIVDFRAFDTLGEIAVLGMAGLIVALLLRGMVMPVRNENPPSGAAFGAKMPETARQSLLLQVLASLLLPVAIMVSIYFYLRGHNLPGGGFIAGLIFAVALILQYVAFGQARAEASFKLDYGKWVGWGLLAAGLTGIGSWLVGFPFLTSTFKYFSVPLIGAVPVASAMFFDLGVFLCVIGGTMLALASVGKLSRPDRETA
ncbi:MAG: monovalent cation/H+ antiporter subunit A [Pseudomonadota bacterium]|nr:monovalent cation/H+ antiporter subunit A [Pseudomonadota bacterium]